MPDQALRRRASPYFRRLPCLKKCWSHGGLNVYASTLAFRPTPEVSLPGNLASPRTGLPPSGCRELFARLGPARELRERFRMHDVVPIAVELIVGEWHRGQLLVA